MFLPIPHQSTRSFTDTREPDYQEVLDFLCFFLFFLSLLLDFSFLFFSFYLIRKDTRTQSVKRAIALRPAKGEKNNTR